MRSTAQAVATATTEPWVAECVIDRATVVHQRGAERGAFACRDGIEAFLDGELFDLDAATAQWPLPQDVTANPASLALELYRRLGDSFLSALKGRFALLIADRRHRRLLAVRDAMGLHPLYCATQTGDRILLSASIPSLLDQPEVRRTINRVVIAEHLIHRFVDGRETHYSNISRVPPGHVLIVDHEGHHSLRRYWEPGQPAQWLPDEEIDQFDAVFERAVERCLPAGRSAIFLSGGFDSVSVAAVAADLTRRQRRPSPHALSLGFPDPDDSEAIIQRSVARTMGLSQDFIPFDEAVSHRGVIAPALELGATWPLPMINLWAPAYQHLGRLGKRVGCTSILSGTGGDEWLNVSPYLAADLMRGGHLRELANLVGVYRRSFSFSTPFVLRNLLWRFGLRTLLGAGVDTIAPRWYGRRRTMEMIDSTPAWVAPDSDLRQALNDRAHRVVRPARSVSGFYEQHIRALLESPLVSMEYEEHYEFGRRLGLRMLQPYLDSDLVTLLYRTPPARLTRGGRTKAMVRATVAKRFPKLGFGQQRKTDATDFFRDVIRREGGAVWRGAKGLPALSKLGVVDEPGASALMEDLIGGKTPREIYRVWNVLNLERWVGAHL